MQNIYSIILVAGGLALGFFSAKNIVYSAHFHIDWVCESGNELISDKTPVEKAERFSEHCKSAERKRKEISSVLYSSSIFGGIYGLILIVVGFRINSLHKSRDTNVNA